MQLGKHCFLLLIVFIVVFCANIMFYVRYNSNHAPSLPTLGPKPGMGRCMEVFLSHLNLTRLLSRDIKQLPRRPFLHEPLSPLPLTQIPQACRSLLKPRYADKAKETERDLACYLKNLYTPQHHAIIRRNLERLTRAFEEEKLELILDGGTVLGSWRHHGIIPYDDDIDFRIRREHKGRVKKLLEDLCHRYGDCVFRDTEKEIQHWKMDIGCKRLKEGQNRSAAPSCLIQIDFFFFWVEGNAVRILEYPFSFPKSVFFPVIPRPFEGVVMSTVHNYRKYFKINYKSTNIHECRSYNHDNQLTSRCKAPKIDCRLLQPFHPFVRSFKDDRGPVLEFQIHNEKIVDVFYNPKGLK